MNAALVNDRKVIDTKLIPMFEKQRANFQNHKKNTNAYHNRQMREYSIAIWEMRKLSKDLKNLPRTRNNSELSELKRQLRSMERALVNASRNRAAPQNFRNRISLLLNDARRMDPGISYRLRQLGRGAGSFFREQTRGALNAVGRGFRQVIASLDKKTQELAQKGGNLGRAGRQKLANLKEEMNKLMRRLPINPRMYSQEQLKEIEELKQKLKIVEELLEISIKQAARKNLNKLETTRPSGSTLSNAGSAVGPANSAVTNPSGSANSTQTIRKSALSSVGSAVNPINGNAARGSANQRPSPPQKVNNNGNRFQSATSTPVSTPLNNNLLKQMRTNGLTNLGP